MQKLSQFRQPKSAQIRQFFGLFGRAKRITRISIEALETEAA
jgi:hypothetical protein